MDPKLVWTIVIIATIAVAVALWLTVERRRRQRLRQRFGSEYDRTVQEAGNVRNAEATLEARTKRVERLQIRHLNAADSARFAEAWRQLQVRFVDAPQAAVAEADRLVGEVMTARGYPLGDFDQRAADVSVDHPRVVTNYRAARDIVRRQARGEATTEDLREAFVHYRALFEDLLEPGTSPKPGRLAQSATRPVQQDPELVRRH
jgi:hypothetical protein